MGQRNHGQEIMFRGNLVMKGYLKNPTRLRSPSGYIITPAIWLSCNRTDM